MHSKRRRANGKRSRIALAIFNSPFAVYNAFTVNGDQLSLETKTLNFSRDVLLFCKAETVGRIDQPLIDQLVRSATSIGANYAEANNAASRTDFRNKIYIAKKEAAETKYWLTLLADTCTDKTTCLRLAQESQHLVMTFQKIVNTLNNRKQITAKVS
jgi:four helix bundle protein